MNILSLRGNDNISSFFSYTSNGDFMNYKKLFISILIPVLLGSIIGLIINTDSYDIIVKPVLSPPDWLFPVAWTILYVLMGISSYLIYRDDGIASEALGVYKLQLFVNLMWSIIFFVFKFYLVSFVWILILDALVIYMIIKFYKINKMASYLQIPYLLWILFASYLTLGVYLLN